MSIHYADNTKEIDWHTLSRLYAIAPLGKKSPRDLQTAFGNSMFCYFVFSGDLLIGAGRALADGVDCSYICDVAIHPDFQGKGHGKTIIQKLIKLSKNHKKIILYAKPGKEALYAHLGFKKMQTAMAMFQDEAWAMEVGLLENIS